MKGLDKYIQESILDTTMDTNVLADMFRGGVVTKRTAKEIYGPDTDEIVLPEGIVELAFDAFAQRDNLKRVVLPSTLVKIGGEAFYQCENLEEVVFHPKTRNLKEIEDSAFCGCHSLTKLDLPDCIKTICYNAFSGAGATDIHVPAMLKKTGNCIFRYMRRIKRLDLSHTKIKEVTPEMCRSCNDLEEVILPSTCITIGEEAFMECGNLKIVRAPGVKLIGNQAFAFCANLEDTTFAPDVIIQDKAFIGCEKDKYK